MSTHLDLAKKLIDDARTLILEDQGHSAALGLTAALSAIGMHEAGPVKLTSSYTKDDKYKWPILDVASAIHGSFAGTYDALSDEELTEKVEWLNWRINEAWNQEYSQRLQDYSEAVWKLAYSAVAEGREGLRRRERRAENAAQTA
jgi:hypothetical protein